MKNEEYCNYLISRSFKAKVYRNFFLYPILTRYLEGKVLDVGCGIGDFLSYRKKAVGVEINELLVQYNRDRGRDVYHINPGEEFPFDNKSFDSILLDNVLEHIENSKPLIGEIYRILKINGKLLVGVPGKKGFSKDKDHKIYYDDNSLKNLFENNYFFSLNTFYIPFQSKFLNEKLKIYCMYVQFIKK